MNRYAARYAALALAVLAGCTNGDTVTALPAGASLAVQGGDGQTVQAGQALAQPLRVIVKDANGAPLGGVAVAWAASGGGTLPATSATGADGVASATYHAGATVGPKTITARVTGADTLTATFHATVTAGAASRLGKTGGDQQALVVNAPSAPLEVTVTDAFGNPVPGFTVTWAVTAGTATVAPTSGATDSLGRARTSIIASSASPSNITVRASAGSLSGSPAGFTATVSLVTLVTSLPIAANYGIHDQFVRNGIAFVCAWNTGVLIYDVGNGMMGGSPSDPKLISSIVTNVNGVPGGAQVHNAWWFWNPVTGQKKYLFVGQEGPGSIGSSSSGDIHVVDVSDLANPVEVAFYHLAGAGTHNFWMDEPNQILYAAYYNGGVVALDVSGILSGDLAARQIAISKPGGTGKTFVWGVMLAGGSLYATDMVSGFWQLKLAGGAFTIAGGGTNVLDRFGSDQWVYGNYAYSGTWGSRSGQPGNAVKIWSLSATGAPTLSDSIIQTGIGTVSDLEVTDDGTMLMFSAEGGGANNGLYFYSLTNPGHPTFITSYSVPSGVHTATFATIGGRRYVFAAKDPGSPVAPALLILDVTGIAP